MRHWNVVILLAGTNNNLCLLISSSILFAHLPSIFTSGIDQIVSVFVAPDMNRLVLLFVFYDVLIAHVSHGHF